MGNWLRQRISLIATLSILAFFWIMTAVYGTVEVQQSYVKLSRAGIPARTPIYTDHRPDDPNSVWDLIAYPNAPLPFIVSLEIDSGVSGLWGGPIRQYFFWCPGYHTSFPIWGREVAGTYEETE
ncbi:hypothetical protein CA11_06930 [Gimesia maris]|uniref:hypothetical protein n=1 Tax=Gimesia maris TaxID=122 RepID=UPI00118BCF13|nr:hypothetical protein [Gimesia maris]QDU12912.1 hypothetical protein CA11_06930 [Gimesia maris]